MLTRWRVHRHSDWLVTLPLLVLKLYAVMNNPTHDFLFGNADLSAFAAMIMVLLGAVARLTLDWGLAWTQMRTWQQVWVLVCYLASVVLLVVLLVDLGSAHSGSSTPAIVASFFAIWVGYPLVAIGSFITRSPTDGESEAVAVFKDVSYALLDTWSKAVFSWWAASLCFGIRFLG